MRVTVIILAVILLVLGAFAFSGCNLNGGGDNGGGISTVYPVIYKANGGTSGTVPTDSTSYNSGDEVTVLDNSGNLVGTVIRDGIKQRFIGWNTDSNATTPEYYAGDTFTFTENTTLFAIYTTSSDVLRKVGPAGGWVFYDAGSTQGWGRYLEAANYGWKGGGDDPFYQWGGFGIEISETTMDIGTGTDNNNTIISRFNSIFLKSNGSTSYYEYNWADLTEGDEIFTDEVTDYELDYRHDGTVAAKICADLNVFYDGTTYDDWFLPSQDELDKMYINLHGGTDENSVVYTPVGGFVDELYWSSYQGSMYGAFTQNFSDGTQASKAMFKDNIRVRPARTF